MRPVARSRFVLRALCALSCGLAALFLAGCAGTAGSARAAPAGKVTVAMPATALPGPSFAFVPLLPATSAELDARVQDEEFRMRLEQALSTALQAKGYRPAGDGAADFLVAYRVGVRDLTQVLPVDEQAGGSTRMAAVECRGGRCSQLVVRNDSGAPVSRYRFVASERTEGGLHVEVVEPESLRVLWSVLNSGTVQPGDGTQARLDAIATRTLQSLPANAR
jgi:hypothetical protein